jgi:NitT/TauT family transport system substrate-binding protein
VSLFASACAATLALPCLPARAQTPVGDLLTLRVAMTTDDSAIPVLYGLQTGRFRQAGLDVRIEPTTNGSATAAGVAGGSYEVGKSSLSSILTAHQRGLPFVMLAPGDVYDPKAPSGMLIVASDSAIHTAKDLANATIACASLSSIDNVAVQAWLYQHGVDISRVKFVELPQSEAGAAIAAHRVAAALIVHPQLDAALATGKVRVLAPAFGAIASSFLISTWFTTSSWAAEHPQAARAFARIVEESAVYANSHHTQTAPMLAEFSKIPLDVVEHMQRGVLGTRLTPALVQPVIDAAAKYGLLARPFSAREVIYGLT